MKLSLIKQTVKRLTLNLFGQSFKVLVEEDKVYGGRIYLQISYMAPCTKTGIPEEWKGRKWYLSEFMTQDEVVKTAYAAFEAAVKHEVMEGFKVDDQVLFNPHTPFEEILKVSNKEIKRKPSLSDL